MKALLMLCALAGIAHAESLVIVEPPVVKRVEPPTHTTLFGWRIGGGKLRVRGIDLRTMSLALAVEHRVHGNWRIGGEYEYIWLGVRDTESRRDSVTDGGGHRASLVVRRTMLQSRRLANNMMRFYADAELGGGMMLASEPMTGTIAMPHAFVGLRLGYTFIKTAQYIRGSSVWEPEILVRAIATKHDEPLGYFLGIGLGWGD